MHNTSIKWFSFWKPNRNTPQHSFNEKRNNKTVNRNKTKQKLLVSCWNEFPNRGRVVHNGQQWLQNKRAWNLRALCEVRWKESEEKRSHTWWDILWWASASRSQMLLGFSGAVGRRSLSGDSCEPFVSCTLRHSYLKLQLRSGWGIALTLILYVESGSDWV